MLRDPQTSIPPDVLTQLSDLGILGKVIAGDIESIVFLTPENEPRTAWLQEFHGEIKIKVVEGFSATAPEWGWWWEVDVPQSS